MWISPCGHNDNKKRDAIINRSFCQHLLRVSPRNENNEKQRVTTEADKQVFLITGGDKLLAARRQWQPRVAMATPGLAELHSAWFFFVVVVSSLPTRSLSLYWS